MKRKGKMKVEEILKLAIEKGIENDPRGKEEVGEILKETKEKYDGLKKEEKEDFDEDRLTNPFSDTRVFVDDGNDVKKVMVGVDMEVGELLLADRLNEKGEKIDLVIAHHPEGKALAGLPGVMGMQAEIACSFGVPINVAESILRPRVAEIDRAVHSTNHNRPIDAAKLLGINYMCIHTPADNCVQKFLQDIFDKEEPRKVSDVIKILKDIPEYKEAVKRGAGPRVFCGNADRKAGKVMVDMTGGTGGPKEAYAKLSQAGVGTIIGMHIGEDSKKEAEENHINVIIAGHIASDSIGLNLILDDLEEKGIEVVPASGLIRVNRTKK